ncbi:hypothetical protein HLB42_20130 (plasmid) [Deinococcus sp. D7000]|nr:hypothetical protein HLB42_20130 [Deinococcus sp. D7000]
MSRHALSRAGQRRARGLREAQRQYHASAALFQQEVGEVPDALTDLVRQWQTVN